MELSRLESAGLLVCSGRSFCERICKNSREGCFANGKYNGGHLGFLWVSVNVCVVPMQIMVIFIESLWWIFYKETIIYMHEFGLLVLQQWIIDFLISFNPTWDYQIKCTSPSLSLSPRRTFRILINFFFGSYFGNNFSVFKIAKHISIPLMCVWQTVLKTKTSENKSTKKQKYENKLCMFPKTVFGVFIFFIFFHREKYYTYYYILYSTYAYTHI